MLKELDEIQQIIYNLYQEVDAAKRTKSKHQLESQFRQALDRIGGLERTNKRLRSELEQYPEYRQQQALNSVKSYLSVLIR